MNNVEPVVRRAGAHALLVELADPAADPAADAATDAAADPAAWHAELCSRRPDPGLGAAVRFRRRRRPAGGNPGGVRRTRPANRRRPLGGHRVGRGAPPAQHRAPGGVLRLRARLRVPDRVAPGVRGAAAGHAATTGAGRFRGPGGKVRRDLPGRLAGRLAARWAYRGQAL